MVLLAIWAALKLRESKARVIPSQSPSLLLLAFSDRRELQLRSAMEFAVWQACLPCVCVCSAAHAQQSGASRAWTFLPESTCPFVKTLGHMSLETFLSDSSSRAWASLLQSICPCGNFLGRVTLETFLLDSSSRAEWHIPVEE
jgi:hypothetical protein